MIIIGLYVKKPELQLPVFAKLMFGLGFAVLVFATLIMVV